MFDVDSCKSYATLENLNKALEKIGALEHRHLVVCNSKGRFTAVFPQSNVSDNRYGLAGNVLFYPTHGFMIFG